MTLHERGVPRTGWDDATIAVPLHLWTALVRFVEKTLAVARVEAQKLRHDPTELFTRAVQPALWLVVFGEVFTRARIIDTGSIPYIDFMTPGILAQSVLFISIFYGIAVIWERDLGIVHKFLASPTPRAALVLGKGLSASVRGSSQAVIIYLLALGLGVGLNFAPLSLLGVFVIIVLGGVFFSMFSLVIACLVRTRERFMGIGQVLTMPLFFASNAIYPVAIMPGWLQAIALGNPLTYEVDALRSLMLSAYPSAFGLGLDYLILVGATVGMTLIAAKLFPRLAV